MTGTNVAGSGSGDSVGKYTKVLAVSVRKDAGLFHPNGENIPPNQSLMQSSGEQREFVRFTLAYPSAAYGTMNPHKEIVLRLTSDDNPLFYYHLRVTEIDFPTLRQQQGLLVDFSDFPAQLESLLDKCGSVVGRQEEDFGLSKPKFILVMKISERNTVLDIVESNPFKYLCHLSLEIKPGSDSEVKKFLGDVTSSLKKELNLLQDKYSHLSSSMETELNRVNRLYEAKCAEFNQLREEIHNQTSSMTSRHFHELTEEKEKLLKMQSELVARFDQERMETEKQNKQALKTLQTRIATLESENQSLMLVKGNQESALQDATNRLHICGEDLKKLQQEVASLRQQNTKLDYDYHQIRMTKAECQREMQSLEKTIKKNEETIQKQHDTIIGLNYEKKQLEDQKQVLTKDIEKIKASSKITASELGKANEIIKKLQDDIRNSHSKYKVQASTLAENDRNIQELEKRINELGRELSDIRSKLKSTEEDLVSTKTELNGTKEQVTDYENKIQSNENMISWLNKQLNELQGLSELNKFRANLSQQEPANKNDNSCMVTGILKTGKLASRNPPNRSLSDSQNNNIASNSMQTSPSWLHLYQSSGNNNHDLDLSSRLEHVSALGAILSQARPGARAEAGQKDEQGKPSGNDSGTNYSKPPKGDSNTKQPSWAKNKPKVTLDSMINKPTFPIWKNK